MATTPSALEIKIETGPRQGESIVVDHSPFLVGRDRSAQLFLDDPAISRTHAAFVYRGGAWILQDLGGVNPPRLHGRPTISVGLQSGDEVCFGSTTLRVARIESGSTPAAPRPTAVLPGPGDQYEADQ